MRNAKPMLAIGFFSLVCLCLSDLSELSTIAHAGVPGNKNGEKVMGPQNPVHDAGISAAAFEFILPVLRHPRCMNCHSSGDFPRQGDDRHPHSMHIRRGADGRGANTVKCSTCHQDHNLAGAHMPPGAPGWHLPPPDEPMIWEGDRPAAMRVDSGPQTKWQSFSRADCRTHANAARTVGLESR